MELGKRRHWQNLLELLLVCWERQSRSFTFSSSGFPKKMKFTQLCSLCLTPQEFPWPFSSTFDREETPKTLHSLKLHEGSCVVLKKVLPLQPLPEYPSMIWMPEKKPDITDRC